MKPPITLLLGIFVLGTAACTTPKTPIASKPVPAPTERVQARNLKPRDIERVRTGEFVKTYHLGRSARGKGGSTMHEAHRVYRLEKPRRWNLMRDQPPLASTGPVNKIVDSAFKPAPQSKAIQAELNHQREISKDLVQAHREINAALAVVRDRAEEAGESAQFVNALQNQVDRLQSENESLRRTQEGAIPLPEKPSVVPAEALKQWGDTLDSKKE